jgi:hypothetical protein
MFPEDGYVPRYPSPLARRRKPSIETELEFVQVGRQTLTLYNGQFSSLDIRWLRREGFLPRLPSVDDRQILADLAREARAKG